METPRAFNILVESLKDRKKYNRPPYYLLLTSTISLPPKVLENISGSPDWDNFSRDLHSRPLDDRISLLQQHLDTRENQERHKPLAHLIEEGYFSTIFTANPDSALERALLPLQPDVLYVDKEFDKHTSSELDNSSDGIRIVKLHGNLRNRILSSEYPNFFDLPDLTQERVKRYINRDIVVIGSIEREIDIIPLFEKTRYSIYYVLPDAPPPHDRINSTLQARGQDRDSFVISGHYGEFETFCQALLEAVHTTTISPASTGVNETLKSKRKQPERKTKSTQQKTPALSLPEEIPAAATHQAFPPMQTTLSPPVGPAREPQPEQPRTSKKRSREEQTLNESIVTLLAAVGAILVLLAATLIFLKLFPTVNFGLLILFFIVVAVIVFGPLHILTGEQITQLFTQFVVAITQISGAISGKTGAGSSSEDDKDSAANSPTDSTEAVDTVSPPAKTPQPRADTKTPPKTNHDQQQTIYSRDHVTSQAVNPPVPPEKDRSTKPRGPEPVILENDTNLPPQPRNDSQQEAISIVNTCFSELMKWKKAVDFAAYGVFVEGKSIPDVQYRYQSQVLDKIYKLATNLKIYLDYLPDENKQHRARLVGTIYDIQTVARKLQLYVTQPDQPALRGQIQQQFKLLSDHFLRITDSFNELGI